MRRKIVATCIWLALFALGASAQESRAPMITFTQVPVCSVGGANTRGDIAGRVSNLSNPQGHSVVLYAFAGDSWWVQPLANNYTTPIDARGAWTNWTHQGGRYAALLVRGSYAAPARIQALPSVGGAVVGSASTPCRSG